MQNLQEQSFSENLDEVNLKEIYYVLLKSKNLVISVIFLFTLAGIGYSLWAPKIWTSSALLTISDSDNSSFNSASAGGLASLANLGMSNGNTQKGSKAIAIAESREFFEHLLTFEQVLPNLMAVKSFDLNAKKNIFDEAIYDSDNKTWLAFKPPSWLAYKKYKKISTIDFDPKSGFVSISISHRSPQFSKDFLDLIIRELNLLSRKRALQQSQDSLNYLYDELASSQLGDVKLAISQLIETQLKTQMLARVKVDYSLETLDKPYYPNERSSPKRKKITIAAFFLGVFFSIFYVLGRFFLQKNLD